MKMQTMAAVAALMMGAVAAGAASCAPADGSPPAQAAVPASPDVHPFMIGRLQAVSLRDGQLTVPNDNKVLAIGRTPQEVSTLLTAAGLPGDSLTLNIDPLLIRDGDRTVLIDTGAGGQMGTEGKLLSSLAAAGAQPAQITDILISHSHGDHIGGLVNGTGGLVFPNATIRMSAAEWAYLQTQTDMAPVVRAIAAKVQTFQPGAEVAPNITAVAIDGHTPGHVGYQITSGDESLLYIGDAMHHSIISVERPDWHIQFDGDAPVAEASRKALLERAVTENLRLYAVHFPFPNVGRIQKRGADYVWVPET